MTDEPDVEYVDGKLHLSWRCEPEQAMQYLAMGSAGTALYLADSVELWLAALLNVDAFTPGMRFNDMERNFRTYLGLPTGDKVEAAARRKLIDAKLAKQLRGAARERNRLCHMFFSERTAKMSSLEGLQSVAEELTDLLDLFGSFVDELQARAFRLLARKNLPSSPPWVVPEAAEITPELVAMGTMFISNSVRNKIRKPRDRPRT